MAGCREEKIVTGMLAGITIGICLFASVSMAETGTTPSVETGGILLAQNDSWEEDSLDDFEFFDEEEEAEETIQVADPLRGWNEMMFVFNDKAYFWVLKPVAQGYAAVVPEPAREGIDNFFHNLLMPARFANCLLQGKGKAAAGEIGSFLMNSTVGVLGFGDPAAQYPTLNPDSEDLGQTFGRYGIGNGFYIVWPFLGSSTLRDSVGKVGDWFLNPVNYVEPSRDKYIIKATDKLNAVSLVIGEYEALKDAAIDPYTAIRDFYIQYREEKVAK